MDDNKTTKPTKKSKNPLVAAAEVIGSAAGTVASTLGVHPPAEPTPKAAHAPTPGKLIKKNKSRLPRRQKKALKRQQSAAKP